MNTNDAIERTTAYIEYSEQLRTYGATDEDISAGKAGMGGDGLQEGG